MQKKRGGGLSKTSLLTVLNLFFLLFISYSSVDADSKRVLYNSGSYTFTQKNVNELIELAEFLARSKLLLSDKKALQIWSIQDFKSAPKKATNYYKGLSETIIPKIRVMNNKRANYYRADMYLAYVNLFNKHPEYKQSPDNFLAIINRYNPPVAEAMQLQQLIFNSFQQTLRVNQQIFNQTMKLQQQSSEMVNKSIRDQATRYSIIVPGGIVLEETEGKFYAEDEKGNKFEMNK